MSEKTEGRHSTIAQINSMVRSVLELETIGSLYWVGGKVQRYYKSNVGHIYFNLVDGDKSIRCMLSDAQQGHIEFEIKNDIEVEVLGDIQVYEDRAEVQIQVVNARLIEANGISTLTGVQQLAQESLYPREPKPIPHPIKDIRIMTSQSSRAVGDFENAYQIEGRNAVLAPYHFHFVMLEGDRAVESIVTGIQKLSLNPDVDIIAIIRGGGRYENLSVFDNIEIARAIAQSPKYIVTGIGHHKDSTLADQVADYAASTPTSVANYIAMLCLESQPAEEKPTQPPSSTGSTYTLALMLVIAVMFIVIVVLLLMNFS